MKLVLLSLAISLIILPLNAFSWTLNNSSRQGFSSGSITIKIGSNTCSNAGLTPTSLESLVQEAIDTFWNKVPTSSLKLVSSGNSGISISNTDDLTAVANKTTANTILIGCNQNATVFSSVNILGVGGIACAGTNCYGAILMNDISGTNLAASDRATVVTALAHEMGHALGLGHTSVQDALMYYDLTGKSQKALAQDDIDGITYLYPNSKKLGGLAGACGTVDFDSSDSSGKGPYTKFLGSFLVGILTISILRRFAHSGQKMNF